MALPGVEELFLATRGSRGVLLACLVQSESGPARSQALAGTGEGRDTTLHSLVFISFIAAFFFLYDSL